MNFKQLLKLAVSVIADMTFTSVLKDHTFYTYFKCEIGFKNDLHMNGAKIDIYFIEFLAMIVKRFDEKNIFHLTWNFSTCKMHYNNQIFTTIVWSIIDMMLISLSLTFLLKLAYQLHWHLVSKMTWVLVGYSIFARYLLVLNSFQ